MSSESGGSRTGRRRRKILDLSGPAWSGGGYDEDEAENTSSSTFLSAVWDQGFQASQKDDKGVDVFEALEQKAQAASMAGKPGKQKKGMKAKFGGTKSGIAGAGDMEDLDGLDSLELEFLREIEENAALTFVQPASADYHDDEGEEDEDDVQFTTEELWEDIDYEQRKKQAVEKLRAASEALSKGQLNLPKLKVENKRLEQDISLWQRDIEELDKKQKKMLKKFPELAKQAKDLAKVGEVNEAGADGLTEELRRAKAKEEERIRQRKLRRRKQLEMGLQQVEEFEIEQDMMWTAPVPWRKRMRAEFQRVKTSLLVYLSFLDPYRFAINQLRRLSPRTVVYFESLRWLNLSTYLTALVAIPQILTWIHFSSIWPQGGRGTVIIPEYFLYSYIPHELNGVNISLLFCILFASVYAVIAIAILNRLYDDMVEYFQVQVSQSDQHPYKYSSVVFGGLNFKVLTKAQQFSFAMETQSSLRLFLAQQKEENAKPEEGNLDDLMMDKSTLILYRIGGLLLITCITVGVWVLIELFFPSDMLIYPYGWERLIAPGLSSFYNHFIVPASTRMVVGFGNYKKSQRTVVLLLLSLYGRFVNIVIILRKQYKSIMDPSRVLKLDRMPDVCFCEDGIGANFLLFWSMDWILSNLAVLVIPLVVGIYRQMSLPDKKEQGTTRPEFEMGSWLMDIVSSQTLFLLCLPFMPAISALRVVTGIIQFFLHQKAIINFWVASTKGTYNPVLLRLTDILCQVATVVYYYIWVYGSTGRQIFSMLRACEVVFVPELLQAPICKLPLLYYNITQNLPCNYDATTGKETPVSCTIYGTNNPCANRNFALSNFALFEWQTPATIIGAYFQNVVNVVGAPVFPWFVMLLAFIAFSIQRDFRKKFQHYVEEERYRLLAAIASLERMMKKKEKLLAIQNLE